MLFYRFWRQGFRFDAHTEKIRSAHVSWTPLTDPDIRGPRLPRMHMLFSFYQSIT